MLNPGQKQANVEQQTFPQDDQLYLHLNLESEVARIRNNINKFENVNAPYNKITEPEKPFAYQNEEMFENDWMFKHGKQHFM